MKRLLAVCLPVCFCVLMLVQSCGVLGGPPTNVQIGPDSTGTGVMIVWTSPAEGTPDNYLVYFMALGESAYVLIAETTGTAVVHNPHDTTGTYKVAAKFGETSYESKETVTTVPVFTDTVTVAELDAAGNSGFGWHRTTGRGRTCSMLDAGNVEIADFYVTDFAAGSNRQPYSIASPDMGPSDPAGLVPASDSWRVNWFTDPLDSEQSALPEVSPVVYFNYADIPIQVPAIFGCYLEADNQYAMVKVTEVDLGVGEVRLVAWYQLVPGLRLVMHEPE